MSKFILILLALCILIGVTWILDTKVKSNLQEQQLKNSIKHTEKIEENIISIFNQQCDKVDGLVLEDNKKIICIKPEAITFFYMK